MMTEKQVQYLVNRFLAWRLPASFAPDAGISYIRPDYPESYPGPTGTNLFSAEQAELMVRHMVEGMPDDGPAES